MNRTLRFVEQATLDLMQQVTRVRSIMTLGGFALAMVVALKFPLLGFGLASGVLFAHLRPAASTERSEDDPPA
jgi:hypothetical protein